MSISFSLSKNEAMVNLRSQICSYTSIENKKKENSTISPRPHSAAIDLEVQIRSFD